MSSEEGSEAERPAYVVREGWALFPREPSDKSDLSGWRYEDDANRLYKEKTGIFMTPEEATIYMRDAAGFWQKSIWSQEIWFNVLQMPLQARENIKQATMAIRLVSRLQESR